MESNAKQFGVDDYKLLASMVTGSSWETKDGQNRLGNSKKTDLDVSCGFSALIEHMPCPFTGPNMLSAGPNFSASP